MKTMTSFQGETKSLRRPISEFHRFVMVYGLCFSTVQYCDRFTFTRFVTIPAHVRSISVTCLNDFWVTIVLMFA